MRQSIIYINKIIYINIVIHINKSYIYIYVHIYKNDIIHIKSHIKHSKIFIIVDYIDVQWCYRTLT